MITVFAPDGIEEVTASTNLAAQVVRAVAAHPAGPLADGDVVVVTSKVVGKAEGRIAAAADREAVISAESVYTVARRGPTRITRTRQGLTIAAAGVDASNTAQGSLVLLPLDPDASAAALLADLAALTGARLGVVVSDTAGRPWRLGQTDQAVGAAGVLPLLSYAGVHDTYGNELRVTETAVADEIAAAADLAKGKLRGRPVAVVRGLGELLADGGRAADLVRRPEEDMFALGSREAVLAAVLAVTGQPERYEELLALDVDERIDRVLATGGLDTRSARLLGDLLRADLTGTAALNGPR